MTAVLKDAWTLAIETLGQVDLQKLSERLALARATRQLGISSPDAIRFAYGLVIETVRRQNLIDKFIDSVVQPKTEFSLAVQSFLKLYVYQTRVANAWAEPDVAEAARIAKLARAILGWKTLRTVEPYLGFLLTRQLEPIVKGAADEEQIALRTFHPTWFVEYCFRLFGRHEAIAFLEGNIYPPPTFLRLNTLKASEEEILIKLEAEGVRLEKTEPLQNVYRVVECRQPMTSLKSYREGFFYVQDKASCFVAEVADPKPGMTVLDVCAAPGAKTTHFAQLMRNQGAVYSVDYSARRLRMWRQETQRMGVSIAEPLMADARSNLPLNVEADIVVLDPPCTSTGSFGRQPSAKWRLTPKSAEAMAEIQLQMISRCAETVQPHGLMIYTTGSVTVEENEMIIERFLKWHSEFQLAEITPDMGQPGLRGLGMCRRLYPHLHESNGCFIAKMQRE